LADPLVSRPWRTPIRHHAQWLSNTLRRIVTGIRSLPRQQPLLNIVQALLDALNTDLLEVLEAGQEVERPIGMAVAFGLNVDIFLCLVMQR
jgi:hypothetical protein